jgi:hypothetical protein
MAKGLFGKLCITNFVLLRLFTIVLNLESLHHVHMGSVFDVSEVREASILRVDLSRVSECSCVR